MIRTECSGQQLTDGAPPPGLPRSAPPDPKPGSKLVENLQAGSAGRSGIAAAVSAAAQEQVGETPIAFQNCAPGCRAFGADAGAGETRFGNLGSADHSAAPGAQGGTPRAGAPESVGAAAGGGRRRCERRRRQGDARRGDARGGGARGGGATGGSQSHCSQTGSSGPGSQPAGSPATQRPNSSMRARTPSRVDSCMIRLRRVRMPYTSFR
jgi:hypothetical protein